MRSSFGALLVMLSLVAATIPVPWSSGSRVEDKPTSIAFSVVAVDAVCDDRSNGDELHVAILQCAPRFDAPTTVAAPSAADSIRRADVLALAPKTSPPA